MQPVRIDHVAVAVPDLDAALGALGVLGLTAGPTELVASQRTLAAMIPLAGTSLELIAPAGNAGLEKFLSRRGPGLHHVCLEVADLAATLAELTARGVRLIDATPRPGARGHLVAFVHPSATGGVLFELCQHAPGPPSEPPPGAAPDAG